MGKITRLDPGHGIVRLILLAVLFGNSNGSDKGSMVQCSMYLEGDVVGGPSDGLVSAYL